MSPWACVTWGSVGLGPECWIHRPQAPVGIQTLPLWPGILVATSVANHTHLATPALSQTQAGSWAWQQGKPPVGVGKEDTTGGGE